MINKYIVGIALGFLLTVIFLFTYIIFFPNDSSSNARLNFALNELDKEQNRLGIQCLDGDQFVLDYIDAVAPVIEKISSGQRLQISDSIILQGEKVSDVMTTCSTLKNMMEVDDYHILSNIALGDDSVEQKVLIIRLSLSRITAKWCDAECIQNARDQILDNSLLLRQRLKVVDPRLSKKQQINR